ncbi:cupin domain-containing protein [Donghicola mangrovi]|uniref:Cupin domain-containing protein n=1 Tax=Donghicola mangrovi TaxID=2729614 RepID=A0A850Q7K8_9RHOB|nr:cupin domain-containing protein [Donghicola mangrovi]NVO24904.1 cupin domain-containing protein [Donghicola mangrovi]
MTDDTYIVRADEIARMEGLHKAHFLNPNAQRVNKSLGDLTGLTGLGFHIIEVAPGFETTEFHVHHHEDECVYVLDGTATAHIGEASHPIGPGDFIGYRAGGLPHGITNTGDTTLRLIVVGQRLPHDVGDYPHQKKRIFRNQGLPWTVVDHEHLTEPTAGAKK